MVQDRLRWFRQAQEAAPGSHTGDFRLLCVYWEQPHGKLGRGGMCLTNNGFYQVYAGS